jgi:hypothetical protein
VRAHIVEFESDPDRDIWVAWCVCRWEADEPTEPQLRALVAAHLEGR